MVARQVHGRVVVGHDLRQLDIFWQVDEHRAGAAGRRDVKGLPHHAGDVVGVGHEVVVLRDPAADLDDRRLLEGVGADHARSHLAGERDERHAVHLRVGDRRHEVERARAARGHAHARPAGRAGIALGREAAPLLMPRQDGADLVLVFRERLVQRHARPARVGEDHVHALADQRFDDHIGPDDKRFGGFGAGCSGHDGAPRGPWGRADRRPSKIHDKCGPVAGGGFTGKSRLFWSWRKPPALVAGTAEVSSRGFFASPFCGSAGLNSAKTPMLVELPPIPPPQHRELPVQCRPSQTSRRFAG